MLVLRPGRGPRIDDDAVVVGADDSCRELWLCPPRLSSPDMVAVEDALGEAGRSAGRLLYLRKRRRCDKCKNTAPPAFRGVFRGARNVRSDDRKRSEDVSVWRTDVQDELNLKIGGKMDG